METLNDAATENKVLIFFSKSNIIGIGNVFWKPMFGAIKSSASLSPQRAQGTQPSLGCGFAGKLVDGELLDQFPARFGGKQPLADVDVQPVPAFYLFHRGHQIGDKFFNVSDWMSIGIDATRLTTAVKQAGLNHVPEGRLEFFRFSMGLCSESSGLMS